MHAFALLLALVATSTVAPSATFDQGMLRVERFGTPGKPAVVFIPALYCGSWEWSGQISAMASTNDIYVVTLPGFDGRPRDRKGDLMNRAAHDIDQLITSKRIGPAAIVGHSLGGTLAVFFAERYPRDVRTVVTAEGGYPVAPTQAEREKSANDEAKQYENADAKTFDHVLRTTNLQYTITAKADVDTVAKLAERSDPNAVADWLRAAFVLDLTPDLKKITAPLVAIIPFDARIDPYVGSKTLADKQQKYEAWVARTKNGRVVMIDRSRHFVMFDQPEAFNRALLMATDGTR